MRILAVTCFTGGEELAKMTQDCLLELAECVPTGVELKTSVVAQGWSALPTCPIGTLYLAPHNVGFAYGMNRAIEAGFIERKEFDYVLCFNNDLQFPNKGWLRKLVDIAEQTTQVLCPATDSAAHRTQTGPEDKPSYPVDNNSAYAWLVPFKWCKFLKDTYGCIVYQEQVMLISNTLADFALNEADNLRKAMGKKKPEIMQKFSAKFLDGAQANGCAPFL